MIAYDFQAAFGPNLATGAAIPKTLMLCGFRKPPTRHAHVGETIGLWTGKGTPAAVRRGVGIVVVRAILRFGEQGILFASDLRSDLALGEFGASMEREVLDAHNDAVARRAGFENWASVWAWHSADRSKEERHAASIARELIAWQPLTAEQIAAIDQGAHIVESV